MNDNRRNSEFHSQRQLAKTIVVLMMVRGPLVYITFHMQLSQQLSERLWFIPYVMDAFEQLARLYFHVQHMMVHHAFVKCSLTHTFDGQISIWTLKTKWNRVTHVSKHSLAQPQLHFILGSFQSNLGRGSMQTLLDPFLAKMFLLMVDTNSKWLEVVPLSAASSILTTDNVCSSFVTRGLPRQIMECNVVVLSLSLWWVMVFITCLQLLTIRWATNWQRGLCSHLRAAWRSFQVPNHWRSKSPSFCSCITWYLTPLPEYLQLNCYRVGHPDLSSISSSQTWLTKAHWGTLYFSKKVVPP